MYYLANKEKIKEHVQQYRIENKKKVAQCCKEHAKKNKDKIKAYHTSYYEDNKEKFQAHNKQYYVEHREEIIEQHKEYVSLNKSKIANREKKHREDNKEYYQKYQRQYLLKHKDDVVYKRKRRDRWLKRRAIMKSLPAENVDSLDIFERDGWVCQLCKKKVSKTLKHPHPMSASLDHIVPINGGGPHTRVNCQLAHLRCNVSAGTGGVKQLLMFG